MTLRQIQESYLKDDPQDINPRLREIYDGIRELQGAMGTGGFVPTGGVIAYGADDVPDGFLVANGQAVSRTTYKRLFDKIGTEYGTGDGSTTFNVPDLLDKFLYYGTAAQRGDTGGTSTHSHGYTSQTSVTSGAGTSVPPASQNTATATHLPPYVRLVPLIKT